MQSRVNRMSRNSTQGAHVLPSACAVLTCVFLTACVISAQIMSYRSGGPSDLPLAVMVKFDHYSGPTLQDGTVPITPLRRTWSNSGVQCSHLQLPLKLAWAVTIHKYQGLTLNKVVIDVGKKFSCGLTFVACSRVRQITDLLFSPPFPFQHLSNLSNSQRLHERQLEDQRLLSL